jgi:cytidyltransferase-like protein
MGRLERASVHGRFQPFHNGHLDYVLQAFDCADFVSVGLTQIFRLRNVEGVEGRNSAPANPLTFEQRSTLVRAALIEAGVKQSRFDIIPFPIETPTRLHEFVRPGMVCFTTELTPWNAEKIRLLRREGYEVRSLKVSPIDGVRVATGSTIRSMIRAADVSWKKFVPEAVADLITSEYLRQFDIEREETATE